MNLWFQLNKFHSFLLASLIFSSCLTAGPTHLTQPNVLFIMSDDHTTQAFGNYGSRLTNLNPTPTLDQLAYEGMIFDHCFVNNSICAPSRAAIITGQHAQTNGVIDLEGTITAEKQFLPKEMKKLGYETAIIGKWHLHHEPTAFDYYYVYRVKENIIIRFSEYKETNHGRKTKSKPKVILRT